MSAIGRTELKQCCEDLIAARLDEQRMLFRIGEQACAASAHDVKDDKYHPRILSGLQNIKGCFERIVAAIEAWRGGGNVGHEMHVIDIAIAAAEAERQAAFNAAHEATEIDYAAVDGEVIEQEILPHLETNREAIRRAQSLRTRIDAANKETQQPQRPPKAVLHALEWAHEALELVESGDENTDSTTKALRSVRTALQTWG